MPIVESCLMKAREADARVVFPEWDAPQIAAARARLEAEGICTPVAVSTTAEDHVAALVTERGVEEAVARRMLARPMIRAAAMVATGEADAMVAGIETPSRRVIEAASLAIGLADGVALPSSFFLMSFPDGRELIFADCAVNAAPDAKALAEIAAASAATASALLGSARVALLSYSTGTSGTGPSVDIVRDTVEAIRGRGVIAEGPVQADAALNPEIAQRKGAGASNANVLIFPSLDAGNIAYKLCVVLAGARAVGPILQGFRKPVSDLSRGATVDDIVAATCVTLALGLGRSGQSLQDG